MGEDEGGKGGEEEKEEGREKEDKVKHVLQQFLNTIPQTYKPYLQ